MDLIKEMTYLLTAITISPSVSVLRTFKNVQLEYHRDIVIGERKPQ